MKKVEIPIKGGVIGHSAAVPAGSRGLVWALNCMPFNEGIALWRPRCQIGTANEDFAVIFDPSDEKLLDMTCVYDRLVFLIKNTTTVSCRLAFWKPGEPPEGHPFEFPIPTKGDRGSVDVAGNNIVVAIEGHGLYVLDDITPSAEVYRIGSVFAGLNGETDKAVSLTDTTKLLTIDGTDKIFIGTITLYLFRPDGDKNFKFRLRVTGNGADYHSLETFSSFAVPCGIKGYESFSRVYEPTTFTIDQVLEPPIEIYLEKVEGDMLLDIESASKQYVKNGYSITLGSALSRTPHMNVNGTLDPTDGVVATARGLVVGVHDKIRVQFASVLDYKFFEEITIDYPVVDLKTFDNGLLAITYKAVFGISGWSHGAVAVNKLAETGVTSKYDVTYTANGALAYTWGRLEFYGTSSASAIYLPFLYNLSDTRTYINYLPEWNLVLISKEDNPYVLAYSLPEKWLVWFRFDEVQQAIPLMSSNGVICFSDGKAYVFSPYDDPNWTGYETELIFNAGVIDQTAAISVHKVRINAGLLLTGDNLGTIDLVLASPEDIQKATISLPKTISPENVGKDVLDIEGYGVPYQFPDHKPRLAFLYTPPFVETDVSHYNRGSEQETEKKGLFPTGSSIILRLKLAPEAFKLTGSILTSFDLYVEEVGRAIQVF